MLDTGHTVYIWNHATMPTMREVFDDLLNTKQKEDAKEEQDKKRLNESIFRFGNVHRRRENNPLRMWVITNSQIGGHTPFREYPSL